MVLKKEVVLNSVAEFLGCWAVGGKATLSLNTQDGVTTITFSNTLSGHPEDPLHPPPSTQHRRRRHRGPARRERDRQRAARHQAAQAGAPPASQPLAVFCHFFFKLKIVTKPDEMVPFFVGCLLYVLDAKNTLDVSVGPFKSTLI